MLEGAEVRFLALFGCAALKLGALPPMLAPFCREQGQRHTAKRDERTLDCWVDRHAVDVSPRLRVPAPAKFKSSRLGADWEGR